MSHLQATFEKHLGKDVILFTTDGGFSEKLVECGSLPSLFTTIDFGAGKDKTNNITQDMYLVLNKLKILCTIISTTTLSLPTFFLAGPYCSTSLSGPHQKKKQQHLCNPP